MMESALIPESDDNQPPPPPNTTSTKSTLLSNLVEQSDHDPLFGDDEGEADLFGSLDDPSPVIDFGGSSEGNAQVNNSNAMDNPLMSIEKPAVVEPVSSKLAFSGLLGEQDGGSSGLFDDIDDQPDSTEPSSEQCVNENNNGLMHEMNLNELDMNSNNNTVDFGMGMGLGGVIPKEEVSPPHQQVLQRMPQQEVMNAMAGSYYYSTSGAGQMHMPHQLQQQQQPNNVPPVGMPSQQQQPGMHAVNNVNHLPTPQQPTYTSPFPKQPPPKSLTSYVPPPPFHSPYGKITITDPMLIQGTGLFAGPPHWTYLVTLYSKPQQQGGNSQPISAVRRRFRHFVALETRLRQSVPGAILPPRPEKHPARAIEEASARQSAEFAASRGAELTVYMNSLANHPLVATCPELKLFLTLQDHIGTAWPEVSGSALTRFTAVGSASVEKLADVMDGVLSDLGNNNVAGLGGEDNAEILALAAYEGRRIGAVEASVPKIEGTVNILKERGDRCGATGLEMSKLAKDVAWCDRELSGPMEVLSSAMLRSGRRTKRLGLDVGVGVAPFVSQYKLCRYEQMAFVDRRVALKRRSEARGSADRRAAKVMMNQTSMASMGRLGTLEKMEMEAAMFDEIATETAKEADEIALRIQSEVGRIGCIRVREWDGGMRVIARGMKEAYAENAAIWEAALDCFKREFPDVQVSNHDNISNGENQTKQELLC
ncbi:hypothetical protein ACHAWO_002786 [Cyclotella atomus]|uniref:PX domain-containing protein n=1 Tax=Cyclotella atomus TaxID=382360 RepID=A0ABD3PNY2_9STRA